MVISMSMIMHGFVPMPLHVIMLHYADQKGKPMDMRRYASASAYDFACAQTNV